MSRNEEIIDELTEMENKLRALHEELEGETFTIMSVGQSPNKMQNFHLSDYTGDAYDAVGNLKGVLEKRGE